MAGKFYIKHEGRKIYRETAAAITKLARELADATGIGVPVYTEVVGVGARAGSVHREAPFVRNPITSRYFFRSEYGGPGSSYFATEKTALHEAKNYAKRTGENVDVFEAGSSAYPKKIATFNGFKRNPVGMEGAEHMLRMSGERQRRDANMARRMGDDYFPPARTREPANDRAPRSVKHGYIVRVHRGHGIIHTIKRPTLEEAKALAVAYGDAGWKAVVETNNPSPTKASKARRTASNKRGAFVEYTEGGVKKRIKYGNKGIATIRAAAMKRDGWRGVRVVSA